MSRTRAAVVGLGAVSGFGAGVGRLFSGLCQGATAVARQGALFPLGLDIGPMAVVPLPIPQGTPAQPTQEDRATTLALLAAEEALGQAALPPLPPARLGVSLGTTLGSKGLWLKAVRASGAGRGTGGDWTYAGPARAVAARAGAGVVRVVSTACASGNAALGTGLDLIRDGTCTVVLCGGVDALQDFVVAGFGALRAHAPDPSRPFDRHRAGLNLGEGAAFMVLEAEEHARARGQRILAYVDGYGSACDATHMTGPDREGRGTARSMLLALRDAGADPETVDFVSLHGTGTVFNDLMESHGLHQALGGRAGEVPVNSIKGAIGHTLGAAGVLEAVMAVRALEEGLIPPTAGHAERDPEIDLHVVAGGPQRRPLRTVLSTSSGFGGINAAVVIRRGA